MQDKLNQYNGQEDQTEQKTILLVDDEEALHDSMDLIFTKTKYKLIHAYGGIEGLAMINNYVNEIDLVLLDLMMPDMNGISILREVRKNENTRNILVILQTGSSNMNEINEARSLGIADLIPKPYDKAIILDMLSNFFS